MKATARFQAMKEAISRPAIHAQHSGNISDYFESDVFTHNTMRKYLSQEAYTGLMKSVEQGKKINRNIADQVASAMKAWALDKGATSFTHWFQPLTGATAEKHDTFFNRLPGKSGIERFSGSELVQQEPDASSFPSGGLRPTFEARGYTAWDPSSPAFIMTVGDGKTLCIPTIFIAYTGQALDYKAPLLKSEDLISEAATAVARLFDKHVTRVTPTLGWEQEYFLVDAALYYQRPDLVMTGRTLVGNSPSKGQELNDHYFGSISERIYSYMIDFETEALKLGIPISTRHNEVAPGQYECAPVFESVNIAVDHNQLLMDLMDRIARRHHLRVLFHEKPFKDLNGSGKHNNWSLSTDTGSNLLAPGKTPRTNLQFLTFFINTIRAVYKNADLLWSGIATAGNDHRLGGHEAPPAIMSVFVGSTLTQVLNQLINTGQGKIDEMMQHELKLNIHNAIPDVLLDNTDRNRTSPFAFTGNKFEIRAVGSSANCSATMTIMNTIVAQSLQEFKNDVNKLIKEENHKREGAILRILRRYIRESQQILFEGDNYSKDWVAEAKKRGLSQIKDTTWAYEQLLTEKAKQVFVKTGVFSESELQSRCEVMMDIYRTKIDIEAKTLREIAQNGILPATINYQNELLNYIKNMKEVGLNKSTYSAELGFVKKIAASLNGLSNELEKLRHAENQAADLNDSTAQAKAYSTKVKPLLQTVRSHCDELEKLVDNKRWPLPKYRELLFMR